MTPSPPSANPSWTSWPPAVQSLLEAKTRQDLLNPSTPKLRFAFMSVYAKDVHASPETEARYFLAQRVLLYRLLRDGRTRVRRKEIDVVILYTSGVDPEHLKQFEMLGAVLKEVALIRGESPEVSLARAENSGNPLIWGDWFCAATLDDSLDKILRL